MNGQPHHDRPALLGLADVVDITGLSERTIRRHILAGIIPARRAGRRILITEADLMRWYETLPLASERS